jgi:hypothetical protein
MTYMHVGKPDRTLLFALDGSRKAENRIGDGLPVIHSVCALWRHRESIGREGSLSAHGGIGLGRS